MAQQPTPTGPSGFIYERLNRSSARIAEQRYDLTPEVRRARLRQIVHVLRTSGALRGPMTPSKLRCVLERLGPTFVKVGQMLSMRSEILPPDYCEELAKLQTGVEPAPFSEMSRAIEAEYGCPLSEVFSRFDQVPLGSASVAQVYRACLLDGTEVAVKVQRPGVKQTMASDIDIMRRLCSHLGFLARGAQFVDPASVIEEFWSAFVEETDFLIEARNLQEFRTCNASCAYIDCPAPHWNLCTENIVVMDYVEGISLAQSAELEAAGYNLEEIGVKLVDNYATQVLDAGFFHADPHPGNIVVSDRRIVYIDLGMTGRLAPQERSCMGQIIRSVGENDARGVVDGLLRLARGNPDDVDQARLLADVDAIVASFGTTDLKELDLGQMAFDVIALARKNHVELPAVITMMARGLVTIEGVLDEYMPTANIVEIIRGHIVSSSDPVDLVRHELESCVSETRKALHGTLQAASEIGELSRQLTRGKFKLNMNFTGSPEAMNTLGRMIDRLALGIIIAGLFIGSSIVYFAGIPPVIFGIPLLGFAGYIGSLLLSIWVIYDIVRSIRGKKG